MMNYRKLFGVLAFGLLIGQFGISQTIVGSAHDFSAKAWNTTSEICVVCHTPHNANTTVSNAPLWNHALTTSTFALYSSATFNASTSIGQPDASSKLCLSCHDGSVALENFGVTTNGTNKISGGANLGTSLADDHPISFTYDAALIAADPGLKDPATTTSGIGTGTIATTMLIGGKMQCASCHDVHNSGGTTHLLLKSNNASALCLTCHKK